MGDPVSKKATLEVYDGKFAAVGTAGKSSCKKGGCIEGMFRFVAEKNLPSGFPVIKQNPGMKVVEKGHTARLLCEADGDPTVNIYWVKDAMRLMPNLRFNVARTGKLRGELRRRNLTSFLWFFASEQGRKNKVLRL